MKYRIKKKLKSLHSVTNKNSEWIDHGAVELKDDAEASRQIAFLSYNSPYIYTAYKIKWY